MYEMCEGDIKCVRFAFKFSVYSLVSNIQLWKRVLC